MRRIYFAVTYYEIKSRRERKLWHRKIKKKLKSLKRRKRM